MSWRSPLPRLALRYTVQGCIGGETMLICVNLSDLRIKPMLPRRQRLLLDYVVGSKLQSQEIQQQFAVETITQITFTNKPAFLSVVN